MKILGIHHICLKVSNPEKSANFYEKVCGMEIFSKNSGGIGLSGAALDSLWLVKPENGLQAAKFNRRGDFGLDHFALGVGSRAELDQIEQSLKKQGVEMEDGGITDDDYGGTAIFTHDPDGMVVEFHLIQND